MIAWSLVTTRSNLDPEEPHAVNSRMHPRAHGRIRHDSTALATLGADLVPQRRIRHAGATRDIGHARSGDDADGRSPGTAGSGGIRGT